MTPTPSLITQCVGSGEHPLVRRVFFKYIWCSVAFFFFFHLQLANCWRRHDVSTLRLLQIVHTSGDHTPSHYVVNDPYADLSRFWREGVGQLTRKGRNRMFHVGQFFHEAYRDFISNQSDPLETFMHVRSSGSRRCLESASALATGLLGAAKLKVTQNESEYATLLQYWQPIPVKNIYPKGSDAMLDSITSCPNAESEFAEMALKSEKMRKIYNENRDFLEEVSMYAGERIDSLKSAYELYQELFIERQHDYHWWKEPYRVWTEDYETYVVSKLRDLSRLYWSVQYDNTLLQTLRIGPLLKEINGNIRKHISGENARRKVFIYSTHDTKIALLLHAFGLFNGYLIPPGATLLFELHQKAATRNSGASSEMDPFFLRLYYFNETYTSDYAYQMVSERICVRVANSGQQWQCPVEQYLARTAPLLPYDWNYQCGLQKRIISYFTVNLYVLATNFLLLMSLFVVLRIYSSQIRALRANRPNRRASAPKAS